MNLLQHGVDGHNGKMVKTGLQQAIWCNQLLCIILVCSSYMITLAIDILVLVQPVSIGCLLLRLFRDASK